MQVVPDDLVFVDHFEIRGRVAKMAVYSLPDPVYGEPETALATGSGDHAGGGE